MRKKELLITAAILLTGTALLAGQKLSQQEPRSSIRITVAGESYGVWPLDEDRVIRINDTNVCEIRDGKARMIEADCPDHLCMTQGAVDAHGGMIVCLPNRVVIEPVGTSEDNAEIDAVT